MTRRIPLSTLAMLVLAAMTSPSDAAAQAAKVTEADFIGVTLKTRATDVIGLLKKQYPKLQPEITDYTITNAASSLKFNDGYKAQLEIHMRPEEVGAFAISSSLFQANALPDGSLVGLRRYITFNANQQTLQPLVDGLVAKYGEPTFIDKGNGKGMVVLLWSDRLPAGLRRKDSTNGNLGGTPYYKCHTEVGKYAEISYEPRDLFNGLGPTNTVAYAEAQQAKECGTVLIAAIAPAANSPAYANAMTLLLANLAEAPDRVHAQSTAFTAQAQASTERKQKSDAKNIPKF